GRGGKVKLARSLGMLSEDQASFIEGVARVRNRYEHNDKNMHRSLVDILEEEQQGNAKIVEQVTGLVAKLPSPELEPMFKGFMYYKLADYLSDALHTLRPPPIPFSNLWTGLFPNKD